MIEQKSIGLFETFFSSFKKGLICSEREGWKHRRKLLSQVFNFDFILENIPVMVKIADKAFEEFELECAQEDEN